jgi:hypothetical protein
MVWYGPPEVRDRRTWYSLTVDRSESSQSISMRLSPARVAEAVGVPGKSSQPQASNAKETTWVRQLLEVLFSPVNQNVQSSTGSRFMAE